MPADEAARWDLFADEEKAALVLGLTGAALLVADLEDTEGGRDGLLTTITRMLGELALHSDVPQIDVADLLGTRQQPRPEPTDPREPGGAIIEREPGATDPYARDSVTVDTSRAVLFDDLWVTAMLGIREGVPSDEPHLAVQIGGRINKSDDRASVLYLMNEDGAAAIISELLALVSRLGPEYRQRLLDRLEDAPL